MRGFTENESCEGIANTIYNSTMADTWLATRPRVTDPPLYCEKIRVYLSPGTFVILLDWANNVEDESNCEPQRLIGCIVNSLGKKPDENGDDCIWLTINLFNRVEESVLQDLHIRPIQDLRIRDITEIMQTASCIQVPTKAIISIAFVFSVTDLENNEAISCQGMDSLYVIRFKTNGEPVNPEWCLPYPSSYVTYRKLLPDCYPSRIWNALKVIRSEISRLLGRYSEKQGLHNSVRSKVTINNETWDYIISKVKAIVGMPHQSITTSVKRLLLPGLTLKSVRVMSNSTMIRFQTFDDLHAFSNLFGQQVLIEVRKRRPAINNPSELQLNDAINIVVGSKEKQAPLHGCTADGIDLMFDGKYELKICVRYRKYQYQVSEITGKPRNCPRFLHRLIKRKRTNWDDKEGTSDNSDCSSHHDGHSCTAEAGTEVTRTIASVMVSSEFEKNGMVFRVSEINPHSKLVIATCIYPGEVASTQLVLSLHEAQLLVANRLE